MTLEKALYMATAHGFRVTIRATGVASQYEIVVVAPSNIHPGKVRSFRRRLGTLSTSELSTAVFACTEQLVAKERE